MNYKKYLSIIAMVTLTATLTLSGCSVTNLTTGSVETTETASGGASSGKNSSASLSKINTAEMFTDRDLENDYDESEAETITLSDSGCKSSSKNVKIDKSTITITAEGTYIISGSLSDGQIVVDAADDAKVQIVLNGVTISNDSSACIYSIEADKVFVTTAKGSTNKLSVTGEYVATDDNNIDAVIFSKTDIILNGKGTLNITAKYGHGVVSKDDLKVCGGTYKITAEKHGLSGKDSVRIADGNIDITAGKDGIHSSNDDDTSKGYTYIADGTITIFAEDDGIHSDTLLQIDNGKIDITNSNEGIEAQTIIVNDGDIDVTSSDDGFNASSGSSSSETTSSDNSGSKEGKRFTKESGSDSETGSTDSNKMPQKPEGSDGNMPQRPDDNNMQRPGGRMGQRPDGNMRQRPDMSTTSDSAISGDNGSSGKRTMNGHGGMGGNGGMGGGMDADESCSLTINGGTITVNAEGDGLDSNGVLTVNGGTVYVSGPTNSGNGAIDSGTEAVINGGVVIAAGAKGMAESFSSSSKQGSMLVSSNSSQTGEIKITDSNGKVLASYTPDKQYECAVISTPEITSDGTYSVTLGNDTQSITMSGIVYGESNGMGGMGRMGNFSKPQDMQNSNSDDAV
ncbi:MAG: carbohydrate-binding domain-containing protein [Lachnospiraceae bacterium]|nr:carbohydrate-binding domain-containing protein [Lachnospiraceae bacterium]